MLLRIQELRKENGVSQKQLADFLGMSSGNLCDWEKGRSQPDIAMLIALSNFFDVSIDYIVGRSDDYGIIKKVENLSKEKELLLKFYDSLSPQAQIHLVGLIQNISKK
jgi:transcriptional regulator with XRE-family HTH domain